MEMAAMKDAGTLIHIAKILILIMAIIHMYYKKIVRVEEIKVHLSGR